MQYHNIDSIQFASKSKPALPFRRPIGYSEVTYFRKSVYLQLPALGAGHQRLQALNTIRPRSAAPPNGSCHAQAQEAWPPVEDPERRRRRFGESVEKMKRASRKRYRYSDLGATIYNDRQSPTPARWLQAEGGWEGQTSPEAACPR